MLGKSKIHVKCNKIVKFKTSSYIRNDDCFLQREPTIVKQEIQKYSRLTEIPARNIYDSSKSL